MVLPTGFGWSVGDIVKFIEILTAVSKAFQDARGAAAKFREEVAFVTSMINTLSYIQIYTEQYPNDRYAEEIRQTVAHLHGPIKAIRKSLEKYERWLGRTSRKSRFRKASAVVRYTLRDFASDINKTESAITKPLLAVGALLTLQSL